MLHSLGPFGLRRPVAGLLQQSPAEPPCPTFAPADPCCMQYPVSFALLGAVCEQRLLLPPCPGSCSTDPPRPVLPAAADSVLYMLLGAISEQHLLVDRLGVFFKQRDMRFYPGGWVGGWVGG